MALTTFGAIMGFAADITGQTAEIYKTLGQKAKDLGLREVLQTLSGEGEKSRSLMEKTRRENVTEMILEPSFMQSTIQWPIKASGQPLGPQPARCSVSGPSCAPRGRPDTYCQSPGTHAL